MCLVPRVTFPQRFVRTIVSEHARVAIDLEPPTEPNFEWGPWGLQLPEGEAIFAQDHSPFGPVNRSRMAWRLTPSRHSHV